MSSIADNRIAIVAEVTAGTTPATPAMLVVPVSPGDGMNWTSETAESPVLLPNRASQGTRRTAYSSNGSIKGVLQYSSYTDVLFQSALSGALSSSVITGGNTDLHMTVEKTMTQGGSPLYKRFNGVQCNKIDLKADVTGMVDMSYGLVGFGNTATTALTSPTYTSPTTSPMAGPDVANVKIGGVTAANCLMASFSVETEKAIQNVFGQLYGIGIASGKRKASIELTFFRSDMTFETSYATTDTTVGVYFEVGSAGNGYRFELLKANVSAPEDGNDKNSNTIKLVFTACDNAGASDVKITKL
jgi:hypothetical protein